MKIKIFDILVFSILIGILISCTDDPNSVGIDSIPDSDQLQTEVLNSLDDDIVQSFSSFQKDSLYWGSSDRMLLGKYENITSEIFISFLISLPDSIKEPLEANEGITLKSSWIELYPNYWLGDSSNYRFSARRINSSWNSVNINQDSIDDVRSKLESDIIESFEYEKGDTVIKFSIDNSVVNSWVRRTFDNSEPEDNGIVLSPTSTGGIAGFQGLTSFPFDLYPQLFLEFEKTGEFIDTIQANPKLDIHIPEGIRIDDPPGGILLQGSIGIRGSLKFDLSALPENILVNKAILELFVDEANTFQGSDVTDTTAVSFYHNAASDSIRYDIGKYPLILSNEKYSGDISQFIQHWVDGEPNEGMEVKLTDESRSASAVSFFGSDYSVESLRPRLTIYYTKQ